MAFRVLVLHGAYGAPDTNWFPWLAERIRSAGHEAVCPTFPTPVGQCLDAWLAVAQPLLEEPGRTVLVGHSLGVAFALRLAERLGEPAHAAFLAAGFLGLLGLPDYDPINETFVVPPVDWATVKANLPRVRCYAGEDDPYVPLERSRDIADRLGAPLRVIPGGGHLNGTSDFVSFPDLWADLEPLLVG